MTPTLPSTGLELRSIITGAGELELSLVNAPMPTPKADEVVVRIEAAPINPSDSASSSDPQTSPPPSRPSGTGCRW
jgi:NADPH:quinone reductase-like Zn-dependent oxidoreductase